MPTLDSLASDAARLTAVARAARAAHLEVGELVGQGGYAAVFRARPRDLPECLLRVPYLFPRLVDEHPDVAPPGHGPNRVELVSATGPFALRSPQTLDEACALLQAACDRQERAGGSPPLARLLGRPTLAGLPCALLAHAGPHDLAWLMAYWPAQAQALLPALARAVAALHASFGPHRDLKPAHIFVADGGEVTLIDPLVPPPGQEHWLGSVGYALPLAAPPGHDEAGRLQDVGALAALVAAAWGSSLGWDGRLAYLLLNQGNGRFGRGLDPAAVRARLEQGAAPLPGPLRAWVLEAGQAVLEAALFDLAAGRPPRLPAPGWATAMLERLGRLSLG